MKNEYCLKVMINFIFNAVFYLALDINYLSMLLMSCHLDNNNSGLVGSEISISQKLGGWNIYSSCHRKWHPVGIN